MKMIMIAVLVAATLAGQRPGPVRPGAETPEPATMLMIGTGLGLVFLASRKRKPRP